MKTSHSDCAVKSDLIQKEVFFWNVSAVNESPA